MTIKKFNIIKTEETLLTLLELTNNAVEGYFVSNEALEENKYYTSIGETVLSNNMENLNLSYDYNSNIIYFVQSYNNRFFKVLTKYICHEDNYSTYINTINSSNYKYNAQYISFCDLMLDKIPLTTLCSNINDIEFLKLLKNLKTYTNDGEIKNLIITCFTNKFQSNILKVLSAINLINSIEMRNSLFNILLERFYTFDNITTTLTELYYYKSDKLNTNKEFLYKLYDEYGKDSIIKLLLSNNVNGDMKNQLLEYLDKIGIDRESKFKLHKSIHIPNSYLKLTWWESILLSFK